jgi:hypothetical protein
MSSAEIPMHIGLENTTVDSAFLIWPDNSYQKIALQPVDSMIRFTYQKGLPAYDYNSIRSHWKNGTRPVQNITAATNILYDHKENSFHEFEREPLIPHMVSTEGPALTVADLNHDGLEDLFIGSARDSKSVVFLQQKSGKFVRSVQPDIEKDSANENVASCVADVNGDSFPDLIIANGGNEFYGKDPHLTPNIYLNDGEGTFKKLPNPFDSLFINASCVVACDFNKDGYPDLFIGAKSVPFNYGETPRSYLLENNGKGKFKDVTEKYAHGLSNAGFVSNAIWYDLNQDGQDDLIISLEWGGILAFIDHNGVFEKRTLADKKGWWNFILPVDLNNDGRIDLIAGNLGLNSRLKATDQQPVRLYYYDFDGNGKKDQVMSYYLDGRELPFANKAELEKQIPPLKKKFLYAEDFAKAAFTDIFPQDKLNKAEILTANYFSNAVLLNQGNLNFKTQALPWKAQLSSYRDAVVVDANHDSLPDILLVGNYYDNNIQMGRYDADYGTLLVNNGKRGFSAESLNGLQIKGQVRHIRKINISGREAFVLARNNDSAMLIQFAGK